VHLHKSKFHKFSLECTEELESKRVRGQILVLVNMMWEFIEERKIISLEDNRINQARMRWRGISHMIRHQGVNGLPSELVGRRRVLLWGFMACFGGLKFFGVRSFF